MGQGKARDGRWVEGGRGGGLTVIVLLDIHVNFFVRTRKAGIRRRHFLPPLRVQSTLQSLKIQAQVV